MLTVSLVDAGPNLFDAKDISHLHDGYHRRKQAVKMADVFGIEKVGASIYEANRQHGDFNSKKSKLDLIYSRIFLGLRYEALCSTLVGRT